ncbi:MAG: hypothetical protein M5U34_30030 [Chloroflexi bacterium]|nr:hypothetical protein [Chloroflexota bacterium]
MEVADIAGVTSVKADQESKQVTVMWDKPATWTENSRPCCKRSTTHPKVSFKSVNRQTR